MDYLQNFQDRYRNLNPEQKEAVDTIEGPVLVIAGPGTGKTELLSLRVANILRKTDTLPSSILCLTFTDNAALNMRKRLSDLIGAEAYKVSIHTFHSFGTELINQNPEYFYQGAFYKAADDLAQVEILEEIFDKMKYDNPLNSYHPDQGYTYIKDCANRIGNLKNAGIKPDEFKKIIESNHEFLKDSSPLFTEFFEERLSMKRVKNLEKLISKLEKIQLKTKFLSKNLKTIKEQIVDSISEAYEEALEANSTKAISAWKKTYIKKNKDKQNILKDLDLTIKNLNLAAVYEQYQEKLHQKGLFDFNDMILDSISAMEKNNELKFNIQEKYQYVLVDEFQDTSGVQTRLLDNLLDAEVNEGRPNILAVGDDDQAIFKFQGANITNILNFNEKYKDTKIVVLNKNYRSSQDILDLVRGVIVKGEERLENKLEEVDKELKSKNKELKIGKIIQKEFETSFHEYIWLIEKIDKLLEEGCELKDIAIIAPKHKILEEIARILDYKGIPVSYERKRNLLEQNHILEIISILKFLEELRKNPKEADHYLSEILTFPFWQIPRIDIWKISIKANKSRKTWLEIMQKNENVKLKNLAEFFINLSVLSSEITGEEVIDYISGVKELELGENEESLFKNTYQSNYKI